MHLYKNVESELKRIILANPFWFRFVVFPPPSTGTISGNEHHIKLCYSSHGARKLDQLAWENCVGILRYRWTLIYG